jgi:hypothetical protein
MIYSAYPFDFGEKSAYFDLEFNVVHGRVDIYDVELVSVVDSTKPEDYDQARALFEMHISEGGADAALLEACESWGMLDEYYGIEDDESC